MSNARADDSDLYTGVVYQDTFDNVPVDILAKSAEEEELSKNLDLLPSAELVIGVIEEEIAAICDIRSYFHLAEGKSLSGDVIQAEFRGREIYIKFLSDLKSNIAARVDAAKHGNQND